MMKAKTSEPTTPPELEAAELADWYESLDNVAARDGPQRVVALLQALTQRVAKPGDRMPALLTTPYVNTIPTEQQPDYPGDGKVERRIRSLIRWNAMAMVTRANREHSGIGGHISSYASAATLFEVEFNHFFHALTPAILSTSRDTRRLAFTRGLTWKVG